MCSRDEREAAGSWAAGLFLFHLRAGGQILDTEGEDGGWGWGAYRSRDVVRGTWCLFPPPKRTNKDHITCPVHVPSLLVLARWSLDGSAA